MVPHKEQRKTSWKPGIFIGRGASRAFEPRGPPFGFSRGFSLSLSRCSRSESWYPCCPYFRSISFYEDLSGALRALRKREKFSVFRVMYGKPVNKVTRDRRRKAPLHRAGVF